MAKKKLRYVHVGTGSRAWMYITALMDKYSDVGELCALCDSNQLRMDFYNEFIKDKYGHKKLPTYKDYEFDRMIAEIKPDKVIVTSMDRTHHKYICRAMELGCDVITEKPMTMDAEKCQQILDMRTKTSREVTVTFNYRYSPRNTKVKEILKSGLVGDITSVHFEWLLNTSHGADYFRRWHRNKNNCGGLLVHKATHHFDLVNWWLDAEPVTVFSMGDLRFYGKENAESRGIREFYYRCKGSKVAAKDPFRFKMPPGEWAKLYNGIYFEAEKEDNYYRDLSVFSDGINIEDNMGVMVRYSNKTILTYSLNAHAPWEGYRVCFNGTKGRLEFNVVEVSASDDDGKSTKIKYDGASLMKKTRGELMPEIIFQPHWGKPYEITYTEVSESDADHGGGDILLLNHIFRGVKNDPLGLAANCIDGAKSILIGVAGNKSIATGLPVQVKDLVKF